MEQFIMKGGAPLHGEVVIGGAKNAALGIIAGALLTDEDVIIENLPDVRDINVMLEALKEIGAVVERIDRHTAKISSADVKSVSIDDEYIRKIRASYYFIGSLLGKHHMANVPLPGGCAIGSRPIDQHIKGFRALGAKVEIRNGCVQADASEDFTPPTSTSTSYPSVRPSTSCWPPSSQRAERSSRTWRRSRTSSMSRIS